MSKKNDARPYSKRFLKFPKIGSSLKIYTQEESEPENFQVRKNSALDDLLELSFPPVRSFDGEKRSYEFRYPNSKRSLFPFELTPRTLCCIDNIKMGVKTGAIIGSIFGGINGSYHALKYKNYMAIPVFAIGGAISFGFFLGCGMIVRCQPSEFTKHKFQNKYSQAMFPIYFNKIERVSRQDSKIHDKLNNLFKFQNDKISK